MVVRPAGLESIEKIGRVERRNEMLNTMMKKVINETNATGEDAMGMILTECLNAIKGMVRHGGFHCTRKRYP